MKSTVLQHGMKALVTFLTLGCIRVYFLITEFTLTDVERILYGHVFLILAAGTLAFAVLCVLPLRLHTVIIVDKTGMRAQVLKKELWHCAWSDISAVSVARGGYHAVVFKITYGTDMNLETQEIEVTRNSKRILARYCTCEEYRKIFMTAKPYLLHK